MFSHRRPGVGADILVGYDGERERERDVDEVGWSVDDMSAFRWSNIRCTLRCVRSLYIEYDSKNCLSTFDDIESFLSLPSPTSVPSS